MSELTGKLIANRLADLKKGQAWLAEKTGVSINAVSKWTKTGKIARKNVPAIASALGISSDELLNGKGHAVSNVTNIYKRPPQTRFEWLDLATTKATLALTDDAIKGDKLSLLIWYFYEELVDNKGEDITPEKEERIIKLVANSR